MILILPTQRAHKIVEALVFWSEFVCFAFAATFGACAAFVVAVLACNGGKL
jgi:hypothetical protein